MRVINTKYKEIRDNAKMISQLFFLKPDCVLKRVWGKTSNGKDLVLFPWQPKYFSEIFPVCQATAKE